ncbi:MAG: Na+/H+ antiporter [Eggerthellaceae bacterium]|nr:Na+/H+ antiporter [Eggerthellaceae bacterium]
MELFELILILLACVIASSILDQIITRVSLPLIQIAVGLAVALVVPHVADVTMDPELFLVLFIAPLLFNEAREAGKRELWDNKGAILSLAIGLVVFTVLVVGFSLNWIVPSIPLASAFALAAALGPTDAAAVGALGSTVNLSTRQRTLLSGESLINDASGVVSFQFAIVAATTGAFSVADAAGEFALLFFGGIVAGLVMGLLASLSIRVVHQRGYENTTVHTLYEVFTPFVVFLAAESLHVSGILGVVAAGIVMARRTPRLVSTTDAKHQMVSSSFWEIIVFLINGVIFVLLGMQLPQAFAPSVANVFSLPNLIGIVLFITFLVMLCRFAWVSVMELLHFDPETGQRGISSIGRTLIDALVTTIAGPKGAVTLSIIFTIPLIMPDGTPFPNRALLIFLTAGVILLTLLIADIFLPVLAPRETEEGDIERELRAANMAVIEGTIKELTARMRDGSRPEYEPATRLAIARYRVKLNRERIEAQEEGSVIRELAGEVLALQQARADEIQQEGSGKFSPSDAAPYYAILRGIRASVGYSGDAANVGARFSSLPGKIALIKQLVRPTRIEGERNERIYYDTCLFAIDLENVAIDYLDGIAAGSDERARVARVLSEEHRISRDSIMGRINYGQDEQMEVPREFDHGMHDTMPDGMRQTFKEQFAQARAYADEVDAGALAIELDEIRHLQEAGKISGEVARRLREDVYLFQMSLGE